MAQIRVIKQTENTIPCCAYARVSTMKEEQESSLLLQESYWKEKLQTLPNRKFCGVFADQGISGFKVMQRKEYCKMVDLALAGFIKEIYTKSIYRFGRNSRETLETIQILREKGVAIIFDEENINTLTCPQDLLLKLKAILGEQELKTMSKNVKFTIRNNFKQGIVPKKHIFGYCYDENNKMIINEEEAKVIRLIFQLYLKGYGLVSIAKQLTQLQIPTYKGNEQWSVSSIKDMLSNEHYVGDILLQKEFYSNGKREKNRGQLDQYYIANNHEAIIDRETFNLVQQKIAEKIKDFTQERMEASTNKYPLSGKIYCEACGKTFRHKINTRIINFDNHLWTCATKDRFGKSKCPASDISVTLLNEIILDAYNEFIDLPYELPNDYELKEKAKELQNLIEKLKRLFLDKLITYAQYKEENEKLQEELNEVLEKARNYKLLTIYKKPKTKAKTFNEDIVEKHIEQIFIKGYQIRVVFKNLQEIKKEYKYEHRKYSKNY